MTIDNLRRIYSSFFAWLEDEDYITKSPVRRIHKVRTDSLVKETLSDENLEILRDCCDTLRDLAMIDLLASTGMRVGELVNLNIQNINFQERQCIVFGKGNKERHVPISPYLHKVMLKYERMRDYYFDDKIINYENYLLSRTGRPLTKEALEHIFNQANQNANVRDTIRCSPHTARHYFAQACLRNGLDLYSVSRLLGHENINITKRYLQSLEDRSIVEMASKASPLFNLRL